MPRNDRMGRMPYVDVALYTLAIKNSGDEKLIAGYEKDCGSGADKRYEKSRQWLEAWTLDL